MKGLINLDGKYCHTEDTIFKLIFQIHVATRSYNDRKVNLESLSRHSLSDDNRCEEINFRSCLKEKKNVYTRFIWSWTLTDIWYSQQNEEFGRRETWVVKLFIRGHSTGNLNAASAWELVAPIHSSWARAIPSGSWIPLRLIGIQVSCIPIVLTLVRSYATATCHLYCLF